MRALRLALWFLVAIALFVLGALTVNGFPWRDATSTENAAALEPGAPLGGAFSLVDHRGQPVSEAIFREKPSVTLFGFTHCPDVCPTGLMQMATWAEALGPDADRLRFIFVTVDPERDDPATMGDYVAAFSPRIVGVTGDPAKLHAMVTDYKIYSARIPLEGDDYTMDHTASMILQDAEGNFVGTISREENSDTALAKLRRLVAG
jgi:protein SCO1/2